MQHHAQRRGGLFFVSFELRRNYWKKMRLLRPRARVDGTRKSGHRFTTNLKDSTPSYVPSFGEWVPRSSEIILVNGRAVVQKFSIVVPPKEQHHFSAEHRAERSAASPGALDSFALARL